MSSSIIPETQNGCLIVYVCYELAKQITQRKVSYIPKSVVHVYSMPHTPALLMQCLRIPGISCGEGTEGWGFA